MSFLASRGTISLLNSSTTPLAGGATFTGAWELVVDYASIEVIATADVAGTLFVDFSIDGITGDRTIQLSDGTDGALGIHGFVPIAAYFRVRVVNGVAAQASLRAQTIYHNNGKVALPTARLAQTISDYSDVLNTRAVLVGKMGGGEYKNVPVTSEGHLEVAIHSPSLPFGAVHAEKVTNVFQLTAMYGINTGQLQATVGNAVNPANPGGTVTASDNLFKVATGVTLGAFATLQTRRRLVYRPGQGIIGRFTALWPTPVAASIVVAGYGTSESGLYFGYDGTVFGILYVTGGKREIQTLTVTTPSTSAQPAQVTLGGISNTVAMTNNGSTLRTAYELSLGTYVGWTVTAIGSTVVFLAAGAGNQAGAFGVAQAGAGVPIAGAFVETLAGGASTDTWIPQAAWNTDPLDGNGPSGVLLDPSKGNVFGINIEYLGFGTLTFQVEVSDPGENNATFVTVHTIDGQNSRVLPSLSQPNFPFTAAAYSAGSVVNTEVNVASMVGGVGGELYFTGPLLTYEGTSVAAAAGAYRALFTVQNKGTFKGRANQCVINLMSFGGAIEDTTPVTLYLIRNGILAGTPNFIDVSPNSCAAQDTAATTVTFTDAEQVVLSIPLGADGHDLQQFLETTTLQPGETITVAARPVTGTPAWVLGTLNTREDHG